MIEVSPKATKAEILEALKVANVCLSETTAREAALREAGTDWPAVRAFLAAKAATAWKEFKALCYDVYQAGATARRWAHVLVDTYRRPLLRSKA